MDEILGTVETLLNICTTGERNIGALNMISKIIITKNKAKKLRAKTRFIAKLEEQLLYERVNRSIMKLNLFKVHKKKVFIPEIFNKNISDQLFDKIIFVNSQFKKEKNLTQIWYEEFN